KNLSGSLCSRPAPLKPLYSIGNRINLTWTIAQPARNSESQLVMDRTKDPGTFTIVGTAIRDSKQTSCSDSEVSCSAGFCIDGSLSCDFHNNCGDNSDESMCSTPLRNANY